MGAMSTSVTRKMTVLKEVSLVYISIGMASRIVCTYFDSITLSLFDYPATFCIEGGLVQYKALLTGTYWNYGGGLTPWNTWISCEENPGE